MKKHLKICAAGKKNTAPYIDNDLNAGSDDESEPKKIIQIASQNEAHSNIEERLNVDVNSTQSTTELYVPLIITEEKKQQAPSKISLISREQISKLVDKIQKAYDKHVPALDTAILTHPYAQAENLPEGRYRFNLNFYIIRFINPY